MREIVVGEHESGLRLDRYLRKLLKSVPLAAIYRLLRSGAILVDGSKASHELRLQPGMHLQLHLSAKDLAGLAATEAAAALPVPVAPAARPAPGAPLPRIVQRDDSVLVIDKPAGMAVHAGTGQRHTVVDWLATQPLGVRTATFAPAPAHRLDRGTSGLLLVGLVPEAQRALTAAFREGRVDKVYHAVVHGVPKPGRGAIVVPLQTVADPDRRDPKVLPSPDGDPARTDYEIVRSGRHHALLRVVPREGRQHQIRAHLAHLGHPIVGDRRYGSVAEVGVGFLLHATELSYPHPRTGQVVRVALPLPPALLQLFAPD